MIWKQVELSIWFTLWIQFRPHNFGCCFHMKKKKKIHSLLISVASKSVHFFFVGDQVKNIIKKNQNRRTSCKKKNRQILYYPWYLFFSNHLIQSNPPQLPIRCGLATYLLLASVQSMVLHQHFVPLMIYDLLFADFLQSVKEVANQP